MTDGRVRHSMWGLGWSTADKAWIMPPAVRCPRCWRHLVYDGTAVWCPNTTFADQCWRASAEATDSWLRKAGW